MFTRNMYMFLRSTLMSSATVKGILPAMTVTGIPVFLFNSFDRYPNARSEGFTLDFAAAGISIGRGTIPTNELDWNLHDHISGGVSASVTSRSVYSDGEDPCLKNNITVTNTSGSDITIGEICYKQTVRASPIPNGTNYEDRVIMLDRTLIEPTITLRPGDATVIEYVLKSYFGEKTVNGVKIVSWQNGSDEEVAAMIDAARSGRINLGIDGGWKIGDMRTVHIESFVDGRDYTHPAANVDLVITSFNEYNSCGNMMQLDFFESLPTTARMNSSNSNYGGYGTSEMRTATLPALADAMPEWIRERMLPFDVLVSEGGNSSAIETVSNNRLALRSEIEVFNSTANTYPGEGERVPWFQRVAELRQKRRGRGGGFEWWWLRSPSKDTTRFRICDRYGSSSYANASDTSGEIAPFLCI